MILANFDLQVTLIFPTKLLVKWPFGSEEVQDGGHIGFPSERF